MQPCSCISACPETRRGACHDNLLAVSWDGDCTGWTECFLGAVKAQADDDLQKIRSMLELCEIMQVEVSGMTRSHYAIRILDWIFERPIFRSSSFRDSAGIPQTSTQRIIGLCVRAAS